MPRRAPTRYKPGPDGEMRRTWNGKLPEEFTQRDTLAFMADTDLLLNGKVSAETLSAIHAAGYDYKGGAVIPMPGKEETGLSNDIIAKAEAVRPAPIREQMAQAAKEAGKENAARPAQAKKKEARDDR